MSVEARKRLAAQQAALIAAVTGRGPVPSEFDPVRLRTLASALSRKRSRAAARAWPELTRALGESFRERFADYAATRPLPERGGPLADGRDFARWLSAKDELPEEGRLQTLSVDLRYAAVPEGLARRRWPAIKATVCGQPRRLVLAAWLPWLGEHYLTFTF